MFQLDLPDHFCHEVDHLSKLGVVAGESDARLSIVVNILSLDWSKLLQGTSLLSEQFASNDYLRQSLFLHCLAPLMLSLERLSLCF